MTIQKDCGAWWALCDECCEHKELEGATFDEAREEMREARWGVHKNELTGEWLHTCPACMGDGR